MDLATTQKDVSGARVVELQANLAVAKLPARPEEIAVAKAAVEQAQAALDNAEWRLSKRSLSATSDGVVFDIIRNEGEIAGPQAPVLSLLPEGAVSLQVYVPETNISGLNVGSILSVDCDGCPDNLTAEITYIANEPEFTPPVIYSLENRQKLVFLVEAKPLEHSFRLKPGQIVSVDLAETAQ